MIGYSSARRHVFDSARLSMLQGRPQYEGYEAGFPVFTAVSSCVGFFDWMCGVRRQPSAVRGVRPAADSLAPAQSIGLQRLDSLECDLVCHFVETAARNLATGCEAGQCKLRKVRTCRPWLEYALWVGCDFDGSDAVSPEEEAAAASRLLAPFTRRDEECYAQVRAGLARRQPPAAHFLQQRRQRRQRRGDSCSESTYP